MLKRNCLLYSALLGCTFAVLLPAQFVAAQTTPLTPTWQPAGWGGGGQFWSTVYHPTKDGVIYMGGDVAGVYKTEDHGKNWRMVNNGLANYGVYSLAVDRTNPSTVYAGTEGGLCKSTDEGAHWRLLPGTGPKELHITSERYVSVRSIAVDPKNGNILYVATPVGKVLKSTDGGQNWTPLYEGKMEGDAANSLGVQFGKVSGAFFGGLYIPLTLPASLKGQCRAISLAFKGDGTKPNRFSLQVSTGGPNYRSKNLNADVQNKEWHDIVLEASDFTLDAESAKKFPDAPQNPVWDNVSRLDIGFSGDLPSQASIVRFGKLNFLGAGDTSVLARDFGVNRSVSGYGNQRVFIAKPEGISAVTVSPADSSRVLAATNDVGLILSTDAGQTWKPLQTPRNASSIAFSDSDPKVVYAGFRKEGIYKSTDAGATWAKLDTKMDADFSVTDLVVSSQNPNDVFAVGSTGWHGQFVRSNDGGKTWKSANGMARDPRHPSLPDEGDQPALSRTSNLAINPRNAKEMYISANWRACWTGDGGQTWEQRDHGADISVVTDVRFAGDKTYVAVMDEGSFVSPDAGKSWSQLWPKKWEPQVSGHNWRIAVNNINGVDRVISTLTPWDSANANRVVLSEDAGKSYKLITAGLPDYVLRPNTMWGQGFPRSLAVDPNNASTVYMGMDGDPEAGKMGGGIFKSEDGAKTWKQMSAQPASRRGFYGLAVDPTDSKRLYWGSGGNNFGLYRSEDGGASWTKVFDKDGWVFNVLVTADGTLYCPGINLWRSTDHGNTWTKLTNFTGIRTILGLDVDPTDPKTIWISAVTWDASSSGAVYRSKDSGATWEDITGDLPYVKPGILRFNPKTRELWAAGVGLFKIKQ